MLKFFNTFSRRIERFSPRDPKRINMFVCGPTVYDFAHIGHARTYLAFDMLVKYLKLKGYKVYYLQNITDIDDKIIVRAKEQNRSWNELAKQFEQEYYKDMLAIGVNSVNRYARATDYIKEIISQVQRLIQKGYAYESGGNVYFEIAKFQDYGKLSHQKRNELRKAVRIETDPYKKNDFDFSLWKKSKLGEPSWESPWAHGRPGWHIEDTAISEKFFGPQYDIHGGAQDLIFPHHESEIAQMEAVSGKKPFVKYWLHTGFLNVYGEKMAKSLKNFITIRKFLETYPPEVLRFMVLSSHYRSPLDYTEKIAEQAKESLRRLSEFTEKLETLARTANKTAKTKNGKRLIPRPRKSFENFKKQFEAALENDFNTPRALALLFRFVKSANKKLDKNNLSPFYAKEILFSFESWNKVFGILKPKEKIPAQIINLAQKREQLRQNKKWTEADVLRIKVQNLGWQISDTPEGPKINKA